MVQAPILELPITIQGGLVEVRQTHTAGFASLFHLDETGLESPRLLTRSYLPDYLDKII